VFADRLAQAVADFCRLSPSQLGSLQRHFDLLMHWNRVLNLTAVRDEEQMIVRHYAESIYLASHLPASESTVADIGSGAGFPGFPVAVAHPEFQVTLIESHQRKAVFLREASRELPNVRVAAMRAESIAEEFDWVVCRAVKYRDVEGVLRRLGKRAALLTGRVNPADLPGFKWENSIPLPWGESRLLLVGTCVSHETGARRCST
jgi:16S rRNA (guanine527-N7)-methyltransferase